MSKMSKAEKIQAQLDELKVKLIEAQEAERNERKDIVIRMLERHGVFDEDIDPELLAEAVALLSGKPTEEILPKPRKPRQTKTMKKGQADEESLKDDLPESELESSAGNDQTLR